PNVIDHKLLPARSDAAGAEFVVPTALVRTSLGPPKSAARRRRLAPSPMILEIRERIDHMPLLRFNILEGRTGAEIKKLLDTAHAAVVAAFHVPEGDRYQLVSEYRPGRMIALDTGLGIARTSRVVLVEVTSRRRPQKQKIEFYELLCRMLKDTCNLES